MQHIFLFKFLKTFYFEIYIFFVWLEFQNYEAKIESLQRQVEEQSLMSSMYSSCCINDLEASVIEEDNDYSKF